MTKSKNSVVEILENRISSIVTNMQENEKLDISLETMASLTDQELLSALLGIQIGMSNSNEKLIKKLKRQKEGQQKFLDFISRNGGWCSQTEYAEILGVSRQAINNRINNGTLLAITVNGKKVIPLFQIDESKGKELNCLSSVNKILMVDQEMGVSSSCTFWLNRLSTGLSHRETMISNCNIDTIESILHKANLSGEMGK